MRRQVRFIGRVQGVGFRATARHIAGQFPVSGWVRNEEDESVLLQAQGGPEAVDAYLAELRRVMGRYIVSEQAADLPDEPSEDRFVIHR